MNILNVSSLSNGIQLPPERQTNQLCKTWEQEIHRHIMAYLERPQYRWQHHRKAYAMEKDLLLKSTFLRLSTTILNVTPASLLREQNQFFMSWHINGQWECPKRNFPACILLFRSTNDQQLLHLAYRGYIASYTKNISQLSISDVWFPQQDDSLSSCHFPGIFVSMTWPGWPHKYFSFQGILVWTLSWKYCSQYWDNTFYMNGFLCCRYFLQDHLISNSEQALCIKAHAYVSAPVLPTINQDGLSKVTRLQKFLPFLSYGITSLKAICGS